MSESESECWQRYLDVVSDVTGIEGNWLLSRGRQRLLVDARYLLAFLLYVYEGWTLVQIGRFMNRHHTTLTYGMAVVGGLLKQRDPKWISWLDECKVHLSGVGKVGANCGGEQ